MFQAAARSDAKTLFSCPAGCDFQKEDQNLILLAIHNAEIKTVEL